MSVCALPKSGASAATNKVPENWITSLICRFFSDIKGPEITRVPFSRLVRHLNFSTLIPTQPSGSPIPKSRAIAPTSAALPSFPHVLFHSPNVSPMILWSAEKTAFLDHILHFRRNSPRPISVVTFHHLSQMISPQGRTARRRLLKRRSAAS